MTAGEFPPAPAKAMEPDLGLHDEYDSNCSTPYVSAPSSPGRGTPAAGFFFSTPASPMHYVLSSSASSSEYASSSAEFSADFEFSARLGSSSSAGAGDGGGSMISADELFLDGKIRPMRLSSHLQRPQKLAPLLDLEVEVDEEDEEEDFATGVGEGSCEKSGETSMRGREDLRSRSKWLRRRTRSMSPLRNGSGGRDRCLIGSEKKAPAEEEELPSEATTPSVSASSSRSNSTSSRSSKRWVFLMDFLHRSKSEGSGRSGKGKILSTISFSSIHKEKEKKPSSITTPSSPTPKLKLPAAKKPGKAPAGKRPVPPSPHELFYTASRAQAEEMRKKTYLPYRQGLLGCLGFSSKSYGAMNGLAQALNPVSSR